MATKQKKPMAKTIIKAAVIIGVLIIPLMYSYFYLSAFWDPYSRLQDVSVAVVNLDKGAKINGKDRNVGKEICDHLEEDGSLNFHFVSEADAKDGLMNDKYYAEVLIPADLTDSISTASKNTKKQHAQIQYVANQKRNYLASQILESGMMPTIKETVNGAVNKEITATLTDKLYSVRLFKEALAGTWNGSVTKDVLILVAIMVVFTLATTLLSAYRDRHKIKEMMENGPEAVLNK